MTPILATDYGNFSVFLLAAPALALAGVIFLLALFDRRRISALVIAALISLAAGIAFLVSTSFAKDDDIPLTVVLGSGALVLAGLCLAVVIYRVRRRRPRVEDA